MPTILCQGSYSLAGTFFILLVDCILWILLWLYLDQVGMGPMGWDQWHPVERPVWRSYRTRELPRSRGFLATLRTGKAGSKVKPCEQIPMTIYDLLICRHSVIRIRFNLPIFIYLYSILHPISTSHLIRM